MTQARLIQDRATAFVHSIGRPLALLILCLLCFGPLIPALGLYWDDWPSLWFLNEWGPTIFPQAFASDRPVQGWLWVLTTAVLGESIVVWQVFGIITRWMSGLALGWALSLFWPQRKAEITWIVIIFLVYPGFLQQYVPMTYSHMFIVQAMFFASLGLMLWAIRKGNGSSQSRWYWIMTTFSILLAILSWFSLEYFTGLELLRPLFLWLAIEAEGADHRSWRDFLTHIRLVFKRWLPYAITGALFLIWRVLNTSPRAQVQIFDKLTTQPSTTIIELARTIFQDIYESSVQAWGLTVSYLNTTGLKQTVVLAYLGIMVTSAVLTILYLKNLRLDPLDQDNQKKRQQRRWAFTLIGMGFYSLLISGWPIWATDLYLELRFPWDRFTLVMMFGTSLLFVGILELLIRPRLPKVILIGMAVGLAAGAQFHYAMQYRQEWSTEKAFFRQLTWRVPGIQPGTLLLTSDLPFRFVTDNSLTAPINWIYSPEQTLPIVDTTGDRPSREMPYMLYDLTARLGNRLPTLDQGVAIHDDYRATRFDGSTSQALVFTFIPPRCLKIIDPVDDIKLPNKTDLIKEAMHLSRPELILTDVTTPAKLPANIFGLEPEPDWCYYFEKAELAAQREDWHQVAALANDAMELNYPLSRENAHELVPFIQGFAHTGKWDQAVKLSMEANRLSDKMQYLLCEVWYGIQEDNTTLDPEQQTTISEMKSKFKCSYP